MLSVDQARARILDGLQPTAAEIVALAAAWGRVLATPVTARLTQPPTDQSAMDGYAVRAADAMANVALHLVGQAPAGHPWSGTIGPGQAVRVFTGSVLPAGADTVLLQEDADAADESVAAREQVRHGRHIRRVGQDFAAGDVLLSAGRPLGARDVGLAAAANHPWLAVHRRPRVAILATGDEVAMPGETIPPGGIVSSNTHALAALVRAAGGEPTVLPVAPDNLTAIGEAARGAIGHDLLLTTGGASVGAHDLVQPGLRAAGLELDFWTVAMRPGKPLMHGRIGPLPVLGLPGNPVSALVTAVLFAWPALLRLSGHVDTDFPVETATLGTDLAPGDHRADYLRAGLAWRDSALVVTPFARQDSAQLRLLAQAEALLLRPPHEPFTAAGASVPILRLDRCGL